jgi:hypothetical protein
MRKNARTCKNPLEINVGSAKSLFISMQRHAGSRNPKESVAGPQTARKEREI